jgi:hypothetical protein
MDKALLINLIVGGLGIPVVSLVLAIAGFYFLN